MKFASTEHDLFITEQNEGLLISQNNKTFLARKWKLTQEVRDIIELSIINGFSKLWVEGHPKGDTSHYICFSRSHSKPWEYLIGGEAKPPNVNMITVNATHRKLLETSNVNFHWQNFGGKHLFLSPKIEMLELLISEISKVPHESFIPSPRQSGTKIKRSGFRKENELEEFIFNKLTALGYLVYRQPRFITNNELESDSKPDIILEEKNNVYIIELKLNAAHIADLNQLNRYLNNKDLKEKFSEKKIKGILLTGHYDPTILSEAKVQHPEINLYSYKYKTENLKLQLVQGKQFGFMTKI